MNSEEYYFWQAIAESIGKECPKTYCRILDFIEDEKVTGISLETAKGKVILKVFGILGNNLREEIAMPDFALPTFLQKMLRSSEDNG